MSLTQAIIWLAALGPVLTPRLVPTLRQFSLRAFTVRSYLVNELLFQTWFRALLAAYIVYKAAPVEKLCGSGKYQSLLMRATAKGMCYEALVVGAFQLLGLNIPFGSGPLVPLGAMIGYYSVLVPAQSYLVCGPNLRFSNKWWTYVALYLLTDSAGDLLKLCCGVAAIELF